jgi:hypothetical protein
MRHHQQRPAELASALDRARLRQVQPQRPLDQHVQPLAQRLDGLRRVQKVGRGNHQRVTGAH